LEVFYLTTRRTAGRIHVSTRCVPVRVINVTGVSARTLSAPVITQPPRSQIVSLGDNVTLHCRYHSDIEARVHWSKLRDDVVADDQSQLTTDWSSSFVTVQVRYLFQG